MSDKIKCKDLIAERYKSRNETINEMLMHSNGQFDEQVQDEADRFVEEYTKTEGQEPSQEAIDEFVENYYKNSEYNETSIDEFHLGFSKSTIIKIELSTGGPADFIEAYLDENGFVEKAIYHYQDWFDGAEMEVKDDDPMMEYVARFIENIGEVVF